MNKGSVGVVVALFVVGNSGCVLSAHSMKRYSGARVPPEIYRQVRDGETTKDWLIERLGPPTAVVDRGDDMQDLTYETSNRVENHVDILLLVSLDNSVDHVEQCVFEMKNDVLQRHYRKSVHRPD